MQTIPQTASKRNLETIAVNDRWCANRALELELQVKVCNPDTPHAFRCADPTNRQIRDTLNLTGWRGGIQTDGDDVTIYVADSRNGRPIGEMNCTSHQSLSPISESVGAA